MADKGDVVQIDQTWPNAPSAITGERSERLDESLSG
jgi:hypothetical protein